MKYSISNTSDLDYGQMKPFLKSFLPFAHQNMGYDRPVAINFVSDLENAQKTLGKTAFYDPNNDSISIYTDNRHPKDVLRSLSHELVHHAQNCRGDFDKKPQMGEDYFQYDKHMQEMEREAYEKGNMTFRDWEEKHRKQLKESIYYRTGDIKMNHNDWKNKAIFGRLMENFGYKANETVNEEQGLACEEVHPGMGHQQYLEENQLEEAHCGGRREDDEEVMEEELEEGAKPDFLDLDKDGDKEESMKKAAEDAKEDKVDEETIREAVRKAIKKAIL
jgi:hypothetical protein|tara:strand:+ start:820 stop:1647 length:828 start_codon:yes stop_codon:yes gene_type:complete